MIFKMVTLHYLSFFLSFFLFLSFSLFFGLKDSNISLILLFTFSSLFSFLWHKILYISIMQYHYTRYFIESRNLDGFFCRKHWMKSKKARDGNIKLGLSCGVRHQELAYLHCGLNPFPYNFAFIAQTKFSF